MDGSINPAKTPFIRPLPISRPASAPDLAADQFGKYVALLSTVISWMEIPTSSAQNSPKAPITDSERMWLTRECLLRYLRATKWISKESETRLMNTLIWRREYGLEKLTADYISPENETGKQVLFGFDIAARPCLYLNPAKQNTKTSDRQVQHLVFMLERTIDLMPAGQETLSLLINYKGSMTKNPSLSTGKTALNILQNHYPERLGRAMIVNVPYLVKIFFNAITPFIDPRTREKLVFEQPLQQFVPPAQLMTTHGGDVNFEYDHAVYWPAIQTLTAQKKEAAYERWTKGGRRIGEYEAYLKGGDVKSLAEREREGAAAGK